MVILDPTFIENSKTFNLVFNSNTATNKVTTLCPQEIETTLSCKFDPSQDTLATLEELEAFQFAEQLEEISGKASSEANLETMLRKVR